MSDVNVLVVFYSRYGVTEKLAMTAGIGAIQARANIRLRRLKDSADPEMIKRDAAWAETLERMTRDYIAPREIDAQWADVILLAAPPDARAEMTQYLKALEGLYSNPVVFIEESAVALAQGKQAAEQARQRKA